ncbi:hypothetical protein [Haladaptatus halobius]|uniref:hypothetical protein n=1 Tax=Haladaptatus halobius TaxID=2884875 RepID=UPI001D0A0EB2|nr:hypothetical protein [Haladaptatus halobius]
MEEYVVTATDIELFEDERGLVLSETGGRPVSPTEKVAIGSVGFRVPTRTRNPAGEFADRPLRFGQNHCAHERGKGIDVAAVGEDWFEPRKHLRNPRRKTSKTEHSTRTQGYIGSRCSMSLPTSR